ncbi:hypothetical protein P3X46_012382 [Hevea brasiliensis]|uniref:Phospholipase A1 n=1 Tax=Hevea brasiliensis TaxID=3981 RepID=A0ABQ9MCF6_HEVBR|nr:hypothetical protein P3X46_012382 [Hevea brasiliensis]
MSGIGCIAKRWKQLSGIDNWNYLLYPLDIDLRRYIIHYGEMTQATYDTFISERDFTVKSYSKQPWNRQSNWIGLVAVATDEGKAMLGRRDIVIAWRGMILPLDWVKDFQSLLVSASEILGKGTDSQVHHGFLSLYTSSNPDSPYSKAIGYLRFKLAGVSLENLHLLQIKNVPDIVPKVPSETMGYVDSHYLVQPGAPRSWHNLEEYLHGVAEMQGLSLGFHLEVKRDIALVNKEISSLKRRYCMLGAWRSVKNKGLVQMKDGFWILNEKE